ncbi:MAG: hypothetical protein IRZ13_00380 [Acetobacteraceae bacterium]|nr:hypothetical protein [Acetobacteraceae bacterium]
MATTTRTVARLFDSYDAASAAVRDLEAAGFHHDDISLIAAQSTAGTTTTARRLDTGRDVVSDEAGSGAGTGATIGAMLGGGAGLLAGIGALAIPGLGPVVAAGWLAATLAGAGAGAAAGAVTGGLLGALSDAGVDEADAHVYAEGVRRGGSLLTVRTADAALAAEAEAIMARHNAADARRLDADWRQAGGWSGRYSGDGGVLPSSPDGTPGNPPGTAASRAADRALGTNMSGAYPAQSDATLGNSHGTGATRAASGRAERGAQLTPRADDDGHVLPKSPDGTPGNPPGTEVSRGIDQVAGTNISGAHPENERKP